MKGLVLVEDVERYSYEIPEIWCQSFPYIWDWDTMEALGRIGKLIEEHREWLWSYPGEELPTVIDKLHNIPWQKVPDDMIVQAQVQVAKFNRIVKDESNKRILMSNGSVGTLREVVFRLKTDEERKLNYPDLFGNLITPELIECDFFVEMGGKIYRALDTDVRYIDEGKGLLPSFEMNKLSREMNQFIYEQENKVVSLSEWKKRKEIT